MGSLSANGVIPFLNHLPQIPRVPVCALGWEAQRHSTQGMLMEGRSTGGDSSERKRLRAEGYYGGAGGDPGPAQ